METNPIRNNREVNFMNYILKGLAFLTVIYAFVKGIAQADGWGTVLTWWLSGIVFGVVFYALGMILDYLDNISARLQSLEHEANKIAGPSSPPKLGNSKANLDKLKNFKI
jgi:hypothetical protein